MAKLGRHLICGLDLFHLWHATARTLILQSVIRKP